MLPDYEIARKERTSIIRNSILIIEFLLLMFIFHAILTFFIPPKEVEDALHFRILAHSNAPSDQQVKMDIQQAIAPYVQQTFSQPMTTDDIREELDQLHPKITEIAQRIAKDHPISFERKIALLPPKRTGLVIQPQGYYETYVLTIGSGRGDNWWCALFPNICFPSNDKETETETEVDEQDEEVTFFVWEWLKKVFS